MLLNLLALQVAQQAALDLTQRSVASEVPRLVLSRPYQPATHLHRVATAAISSVEYRSRQRGMSSRPPAGQASKVLPVNCPAKALPKRYAMLPFRRQADSGSN